MGYNQVNLNLRKKWIAYEVFPTDPTIIFLRISYLIRSLEQIREGSIL